MYIKKHFHGKDEVTSSTLVEGTIVSSVVGFDATENENCTTTVQQLKKVLKRDC